MDGWPEVSSARENNRRELVLKGGGREDAPPDEAFELDKLSLLSVSATTLSAVPASVERAANLRELLLFGNRLTALEPAACRLRELRVLDVSDNLLEALPDEVGAMPRLEALNASGNRLRRLPRFRAPLLRELNATRNAIDEFPDVCSPENERLAEVRLGENAITVVPPEVADLPALRLLDLSHNSIAVPPKRLSLAPKLKELLLKGNPVADDRLRKLIEQCGSKQVLAHLRKGADKSERERDRAESTAKRDAPPTVCDKIVVRRYEDATSDVCSLDAVKAVRPHVVCCLIEDVALTEESLKRFLQAQTKLHDTICDKRNVATIATHDFDKIPRGNLKYTARAPHALTIHPLARTNKCSALQLYTQLRKEADDYRKEKKRNTFSGVHKYLYLLEGKSVYPCMEDIEGNVISFPPITNSEQTKISCDTRTILVEVTSSINQSSCRSVMDALLSDALNVGLGGRADGEDRPDGVGIFHQLKVRQMRIVDLEGKMKLIYPSKIDLCFENRPNLQIIRE